MHFMWMWIIFILQDYHQMAVGPGPGPGLVFHVPSPLFCCETLVHINPNSWIENLGFGGFVPLNCTKMFLTSQFSLLANDVCFQPFTLPETNIFAPKNGWLENDPFLLGPGLFSGASC